MLSNSSFAVGSGPTAFFLGVGADHLAIVIVPAVLCFSVILAVGIGRLVLRGLFCLLGQRERQATTRKAALLERDSTGYIPL